MRQGKIFAGIIVMIFGVIASIIGIVFLVIYSVKKTNCTLEVTALVVYLDKDTSFDDGTYSESYAPVFYYEVDGNDFMETYNLYSNPSQYEVGDQVDLLVNPDNPTNFLVADSIWMQLTGGICLGVGIFLTILASILIRSGKSSARRNRSFQKARQYQQNVYTAVPVREKQIQTNRFNLNGEWHETSHIEQPGYYNLNGKIVSSKDPYD